MIEVRQTATFSKWMAGLPDRRARAKIAARIDRMVLGNPVMLSLSEKVSANFGFTLAPGIVFILCGGAGH